MKGDAVFLNAGAGVAEVATESIALKSELPSNPFVGLRPFESTESVLFFGRGEQIVGLLQQLHRTRFLAVLGSSGCGKSSLIRAGLIPKLKANFLVERRDHWKVAIMKPGDAPLDRLAEELLNAVSPRQETGDVAAFVKAMRIDGAREAVERLRAPMAKVDANILLVVDQFEELFRFAQPTGRTTIDDEEMAVEGDDDSAEVKARNRTDELKKQIQRDTAARFVAIILDLARQRELPIYVVMTMRSDFLGDCDAFSSLPETINKCLYLVPRLNRQSRQEVVEKPVTLYDENITPRLIDRVVNDIGDESDQLPVMQHALMRTWEKWLVDHAEGEPIDLRHYEAAGTIVDALSQDADKALGEMEPDEQLIAERMFQALVDTDAQGRRVRRPVHLNHVAAIADATPPEVLSVVDHFRRDGRCFLVLSKERAEDNPLIDISHESFIRQWKTLRKWVKAENYSKEVYTRLAGAAFRREKKRGGLWTDPELQLALDWWVDRNPNEAWGKRYYPTFRPAEEFLRESREKQEKIKAQEEEDQLKRRETEKLRRQNLRLRRLTYALVLLALLATGALGVTFLSVRRAVANASEANKQRAYANVAQAEALKQLGYAEEARSQALEQLGLAQAARAEAEKQKIRANQETAAANKAREDLRVANESRLNAMAQARKALLGKLGGLYQQAISMSGNQETEDQSIQTYEKILDIYEKDGVRAGRLSTLFLLGDKFDSKELTDAEDAKKAIGYYERTLPLFDTTNKGDKQSKADTLIRMGDLFNTALDDSKGAAARYEQALQEGYQPDIGDTRDVYLTLGSIYAEGQTREDRIKAIGYYEKQLSLLDRQIVVADENPDGAPKAKDLDKAKLDLLIRTGSLHYLLDEKQKAKELFDSAIEFARVEGDEVGGVDGVFISIGLNLHQQGDEPEAEVYFDRAIQNARHSKDPGSEDVAYLNIGRGLTARKKYDAAIQYLTRAKDHVKPTEKKTLADVLSALGRAYKAKGMKKEALDNYKAALVIYQELGTRNLIVTLQKTIKALEGTQPKIQ